MGRINKAITGNKKPILIALLQWFITTVMQFDRAFFEYGLESYKFLLIKALYLMSLSVAWCFAFHVYKKIKANDQLYMRGFQIFLIYYTLMMALLVILWPGTWSWDDLWTLSDISRYSSFNAWQHILTGLYQDILLQYLPFPGGIILLQNCVISVCVAFIVVKLECTFSIQRLNSCFLDILLKVLPFLLFPVLQYQFSGYRMGLYVYLELTMLTILICAPHDQSIWGYKYSLFLCFLVLIVSVWRTESFFYVPCVCVLLLLLSKTILSVRRKIICVLLMLIGFFALTNWQNYSLGNSNYNIVSLLRPCVELVRAADNEEDAEELAAIDKVVDLRIVQDHPGSNGEQLYWDYHCLRTQNNDPEDDFTDKEYKNLISAMIKLSIKYPKVVFAERWNVFLTACGIKGQTVTSITRSARLYDEEEENRSRDASFYSHNWLATKPVFQRVRKRMIFLMGIKTKNGDSIGVLTRLVWNSLVPIMFLIYAWIKLLFQKKWFLWILCSAVVVRIPVVFLTEPSPWLMYHLSFYLLGYTLAVYYIWIRFSTLKRAKNG